MGRLGARGSAPAVTCNGVHGGAPAANSFATFGASEITFGGRKYEIMDHYCRSECNKILSKNKIPQESKTGTLFLPITSSNVNRF